LLLLSLRSPQGEEQSWNPARIRVVVTSGYGQGGHDLSDAPYADNLTGWYSTGRYVQATPALYAPDLAMRLYYDAQDWADLDDALAPRRLRDVAALSPWLLRDGREADPSTGHAQVASDRLIWYDAWGRDGVPSWVAWQDAGLQAAVLRQDSIGAAGLGSGGLGLGYGPRYPLALDRWSGRSQPDGHHLSWQMLREWDLAEFEVFQAWGDEPFRSLGPLPAQGLGLAADSVAGYEWLVPGEALGPGRYAYYLAARHGSGWVQLSDTLWLDWRLEDRIQVYPNPTRGPLRVVVPFPEGQSVTLQILDGTRRRLQGYTWVQGESMPPVSLAPLPVGLYYYHLASGDSIYQGKILRYPD
jgi:hypothetical protein